MPSLARFLSLPQNAQARMAIAQLAIAAALTAPAALLAQQGQSAPPTITPELGPVLVNPIPPDQLAFLSAFAGRPSRELLRDKTFRKLMKAAIPGTTYHYGRDMSLEDAVDAVEDGSKLPVMLRDGRYLMVSGQQGQYLSGRGFLWFDLQEGIALGVFYFTPTNGEPTPTLTIYSKQIKGKVLAMSEMPPAFVQDLYQWEAIAKVPPVSPRYFIPVNGKKYVLVHDEDYCWHPENTPAPQQSMCEKANADAADADLNAAYFITQTRNAADATAWMLEPDQVAWLGLRARSCAGPDALACQIRMTRERTWVLIGGPPRPPRPRPQQASR